MIRSLSAWIVALLSMTAIAGGLYVYKRNALNAAAAGASAAYEPMEAVATAQARRGSWTPVARAIGTVVAMHQLDIRNELAGTVARLGFESGAIVEKGQALVELDTRQEQASLAAAEAEARLAKVTYDRRQALKGSPAFSPQELDKAREDHAAARARAHILEVTIEKKKIVSPFKARVGITDLQPGAYLEVGTVIARLRGIDTDAFVDFSLPQDVVSLLKIGSEIKISGPGIPQGSTAAAIVAEDDSIDASSRMVRFRAAAKGVGSNLRPGAFVDVWVETSEPRQTVFVPLSAVRRSTSGQHVFVVAEKGGKLRAEQRAVATGPVQNDDIAIEKGLEAGEVIATSGSFKLRDGVAIQPETPPASPSAVNVQ